MCLQAFGIPASCVLNLSEQTGHFTAAFGMRKTGSPDLDKSAAASKEQT
jgi:hypothetical protein